MAGGIAVQQTGGHRARRHGARLVRRGWNRQDPHGWITSELGGHVYGLDSIFDEAQKRSLPPPQSVDELRELLHQHLYVEGDDARDFIRLGERALRVRTDDDEVFSHHIPVRTVRPAPAGPESVFSVRLCWESPDTDRNLDLAGAVVFPV